MSINTRQMSRLRLVAPTVDYTRAAVRAIQPGRLYSEFGWA
ncbi:hypothetical protein [Embleya sp. MST-111070]